MKVAGLAVLLVLAAVLTGTVATAFFKEAEIISKRVDGAIPIADLDSPLWGKALPAEVELGSQTVTKPILASPSIQTVTVRSIHNETWIAFRLDWKDSRANANTTGVKYFTDAAAIQFPILEGQPFLAMGEEGKPVNIWQWRADWQRDLDETLKEVEASYPNLWVDLYPSGEAEPSDPVAPLSKIDKTFVPGWAAENPLSQPVKLTPISDMMAEGFGTLTYKPEQKVLGRGVWDRDNGGWRAVFARPLQTGDANDAQFNIARFNIGGDKPMAIAVWDGENGEVDGRKAVSPWLTLRVEGSFLPLAMAALLTSIPVIAIGVTVTLLRRHESRRR